MAINWTALSAIGIFLAAIVALFRELLVRLWWRPVLTATILPWGNPHSHLTAHYTTDAAGQAHQGAVYYFRLWVENKGNVRAEQVQVFVAKLLRKNAASQFHEVESFLPMSLRWSHSGSATSKIFTSLNPKMSTHCDIGFIEDPPFRAKTGNTLPDAKPRKTLLSLQLEVQPATKSHLLIPGDYRLELLIGAAMIFPCDTGHQVKDLIMIQDEVINEKTTQNPQSGI